MILGEKEEAGMSEEGIIEVVNEAVKPNCLCTTY